MKARFCSWAIRLLDCITFRNNSYSSVIVKQGVSFKQVKLEDLQVKEIELSELSLSCLADQTSHPR